MNGSQKSSASSLIQDPVCEGLEVVRNLIESELDKSTVGTLVRDARPGLFGGKMLRSRLIFHMGAAAGLPASRLVECATTVEMIHAASLLHDDVVDGGVMRRGQPTFWMKKGTQAAILMGDWLVSRAAGHLHNTDAALFPDFILTLQEMCDAEIEQELRTESQPNDWELAESIARRKTGSLFGFSARCAASDDPDLRDALRQAGYDIGTAYQLADDIQDMYPPESTDKTLGLDAKDGKCTVACTWLAAGIDPVLRVKTLTYDSAERLAGWPAIQSAWRTFVECEIHPVISHFMEQFAMEKVS
ncbi:MAG: hypothetical protein C0404_09155 [Verrucomicrobia bacterium]|nr:hypothetical protein [Verrucomicrobiota bacterium]